MVHGLSLCQTHSSAAATSVLRSLFFLTFLFSTSVGRQKLNISLTVSGKLSYILGRILMTFYTNNK